MSRTRKQTQIWQVIYAGLIIIVFAVAGWFTFNAFADTLTVTSEAEAGALSGVAKSCQAANASANTSVRFGATDCNTTGRTYANPIKLDTADPGVLAWEGRYYMVNTSNTALFQIFVSDDLVNWQTTNTSIYPSGVHPWATKNFWAPELHRTANGFAFYYSAFDGTANRIGVATASNILGPYTDLGHPLIAATYASIDVNFFRDDDGKQYLFWKEDEGNTRIFGQEISADGTVLTGTPVVLMQKSLPWEETAGIEGPWLMKKNGQYYMFYSGAFFGSEAYSVGVAKAATPLGTYTKRADPILKSGNRWKGPGHNTVVSIGNNDYALYHAWDGAITGNRVGMLDKITWEADGWPTIGYGTPTESPQPYPN